MKEPFRFIKRGPTTLRCSFPHIIIYFYFSSIPAKVVRLDYSIITQKRTGTKSKILSKKTQIRLLCLSALNPNPTSSWMQKLRACHEKVQLKFNAHAYYFNPFWVKYGEIITSSCLDFKWHWEFLLTPVHRGWHSHLMLPIQNHWFDFNVIFVVLTEKKIKVLKTIK